MLVKNDYVNKNDVVFVKESDSLESVMKTLEDSGYRCIPVLDETGEKYVGNIYKVDLLEYELDYSLVGTLSDLVSDREGYIKEDAPFFKVFSSIKKLPYLAVVNDSMDFLGILTNGNVIQVLENAWGVHNGSYSFTIGTIEYAGALQKMLRIVNRHCNVQSVISLNNNSNYVRRVCIVLPKEVDEDLAEKIRLDLDKNNFTVTDIEKLN
ncbi:CBS domain-containing protein [Ornithinibacillus sp. BX22]|uniref:CBS domain-containing protein n=2 Tax=Ornithinibacillus TaxID=484508 RepID=A0A923L7C9_9BACI|nr:MULTISPECIES: cyclic di-AMP binding protein CbpA [Ornithinibacillus]MBC5637779.1 CBS domain-containing protein [Ornithinibacillus hominis]MBS3681951.1 CBS domain-containing protein [Ornithinibacillus massiliensis]